jgi:hypothetical protein
LTRGAPRRSFGFDIELIVTDYLMPGTLAEVARMLSAEVVELPARRQSREA